jgi:hypothetical protein
MLDQLKNYFWTELPEDLADEVADEVAAKAEIVFAGNARWRKNFKAGTDANIWKCSCGTGWQRHCSSANRRCSASCRKISKSAGPCPSFYFRAGWKNCHRKRFAEGLQHSPSNTSSTAANGCRCEFNF